MALTAQQLIDHLIENHKTIAYNLGQLHSDLPPEKIALILSDTLVYAQPVLRLEALKKEEKLKKDMDFWRKTYNMVWDTMYRKVQIFKVQLVLDHFATKTEPLIVANLSENTCAELVDSGFVVVELTDGTHQVS